MTASVLPEVGRNEGSGTTENGLDAVLSRRQEITVERKVELK
jgi:hypothetical protein